MDLTPVADFFRRFETERVFAWLKTLNMGELVHNRYFVGAVAALAILSYLMRWRLLLAAVLGVAGFAWLLSYTLQQGTSLGGGLENSSLLVFVGGGVVIVGVVIYLLFIRTD